MQENWEQDWLGKYNGYTVSMSVGIANPLHNSREEVSNNDDIDPTRTHLNVCLCDEHKFQGRYEEQEHQIKNWYQRDCSREEILKNNTPIQEYIDQFNDRQRKNNHYDRLTDITKEMKKSHITFVKNKDGIRQRKKYIQEHEVIFQIGNRDSHIKDIKITDNLFTNLYKQFKEENPNAIITQAYIHNDESTPHLHISFYTCERKEDKNNNLKLDWSFNTYASKHFGCFQNFKDRCVEMLEHNASMEKIKTQPQNTFNKERHQEMRQYKFYQRQQEKQKEVERLFVL